MNEVGFVSGEGNKQTRPVIHSGQEILYEENLALTVGEFLYLCMTHNFSLEKWSVGCEGAYQCLDIV